MGAPATAPEIAFTTSASLRGFCMQHAASGAAWVSAVACTQLHQAPQVAHSMHRTASSAAVYVRSAALVTTTWIPWEGAAKGCCHCYWARRYPSSVLDSLQADGAAETHLELLRQVFSAAAALICAADVLQQCPWWQVQGGGQGGAQAGRADGAEGRESCAVGARMLADSVHALDTKVALFRRCGTGKLVPVSTLWHMQ